MKQMIHPLGDDFFARMAAAQPHLTPKMARLAAYVSEHYVRVAILSTRDLAAAAKVSLATVVRFATVLGYPTFDALRASIQDRVNFDLTGVERLRAMPASERSPSARLGRIIERDAESLRALAQHFSEPQLDKFAGLLCKAERITVAGFRYVGPLALYFAYALGKIKPGVEAFTAADSSLYDRVQLMNGGDVLVVLAFPRYPADLVKLVHFAREQGVTVLAITDSPLSPVLPHAKVALFAKASMLDFVGSMAAPAALINCVVSEVGLRLGKRALDRLRSLEDAAQAAGIYISAGGPAAPAAERRQTWGALGVRNRK